MTKLERLAIRRIQRLAESLPSEMTAYALYAGRPVEELRALDVASSEKWTEHRVKRAEVIDWVEALLEEQEKE